jgi:drug/metabolite transporter (DMT)-like permease
LVRQAGRVQNRKATLALAVTVVLWAVAFPAIRAALPGYGVTGLSFLRLAVASAALAVAAPLLRVRPPRPRDLPLVALCGATGMSAYQLLLNWGEVNVPAGTASLLIAVAPVFSMLLAVALLDERLTPLRLAGTLVALSGSAVIALAGGRSGWSAGAVVVLGAALVQGAYHCATKPLLRRYTGLEVACHAMWAGTLMLLPLAPDALRRAATATPAQTAAALWLGLAPSAIGFVTWGYAVARRSVTRATSALYLVPVVALAVAYAWLGERPGVAGLAGGAVSVAGVVLSNAGTRRGALFARSTRTGRRQAKMTVCRHRHPATSSSATTAAARRWRRSPNWPPTSRGAAWPG